MVKILEGEGRLGTPGRAWTRHSKGGQRLRGQRVNAQVAIPGGLRGGGLGQGQRGLQAQDRMILYSLQNSDCKVSAESLLPYQGLQVVLPLFLCYSGHTPLIRNIPISKEFLTTIL